MKFKYRHKWRDKAFEQIHVCVRGSILNRSLQCTRSECEQLSAAGRRAAKGQAGARHQEEARSGSGTVQRTASAVRVLLSSASTVHILFSLSLCLSFSTFKPAAVTRSAIMFDVAHLAHATKCSLSRRKRDLSVWGSVGKLEDAAFFRLWKGVVRKLKKRLMAVGNARRRSDSPPTSRKTCGCQGQQPLDY